MSKRKLIDLNDVNEPFWPASPNVDTEGIDEWKERIITSLAYHLGTSNEATKMYEDFILKGKDDEDREVREAMVGPALRDQIGRCRDYLTSLFDLGPVLL